MPTHEEYKRFIIVFLFKLLNPLRIILHNIHLILKNDIRKYYEFIPERSQWIRFLSIDRRSYQNFVSPF